MNFILFSILSVLASAADQKAHFAGGCFWCVETAFEGVKGISKVTVGYSGGEKKDATYKQVSSGTTGHREAVEVEYDPQKVTYEELLKIFWHNIDPFDDKGQFCDKGEQYKAAIYFHNDGEKSLAEKSKTSLKLTKPIVTDIIAFKSFFPAEDYHQSYYLKNPVRYKFYRYSCGRDKRLKEVWK